MTLGPGDRCTAGFQSCLVRFGSKAEGLTASKCCPLCPRKRTVGLVLNMAYRGRGDHFLDF
jgi:hypothetical protein